MKSSRTFGHHEVHGYLDFRVSYHLLLVFDFCNHIYKTMNLMAKVTACPRCESMRRMIKIRVRRYTVRRL